MRDTKKSSKHTDKTPTTARELLAMPVRTGVRAGMRKLRAKLATERDGKLA